MSLMTHTTPAALAAEAAMRRPHHRHPVPPRGHAHALVDLIKHFSAWLAHPSFAGLLPTVAHYLELAVIFSAAARHERRSTSQSRESASNLQAALHTRSGDRDLCVVCCDRLSRVGCRSRRSIASTLPARSSLP